MNDQIIPVSKGTHVHIPVGAKHRIRNTGSMILRSSAELTAKQQTHTFKFLKTLWWDFGCPAITGQFEKHKKFNQNFIF